jgi:hypothetical protein
VLGGASCASSTVRAGQYRVPIALRVAISTQSREAAPGKQAYGLIIHRSQVRSLPGQSAQSRTTSGIERARRDGHYARRAASVQRRRRDWAPRLTLRHPAHNTAGNRPCQPPRMTRWKEPARATTLEHFLPVGLGFLAGVVAAWVSPRSTESRGFFALAAQVLPVLLLALAIEARVFGIFPRRAAQGDKLARTMEQARWWLGVGTVIVLLVGELHALWALSNDPAERTAWIEYGALAWGFTTVGTLAILGLGRPRTRSASTDRNPQVASAPESSECGRGRSSGLERVRGQGHHAAHELLGPGWLEHRPLRRRRER